MKPLKFVSMIGWMREKSELDKVGAEYSSYRYDDPDSDYGFFIDVSVDPRDHDRSGPWDGMSERDHQMI